MTFDNVGKFADRDIDYSWNPGESLGEPLSWMPRISVGYDDPSEDWIEAFKQLLKAPGVEELQALSVGNWGGAYDTPSADVATAIERAAGLLPNLRTLVFGDMSYEECEVSWMINSDLGPMLNAYPQLENVLIRGGQQLGLSGLELPNLKRLVVQTGGLDASVVKQIAEAELPELQHLEIYFGDENYGATATLEDARPFLNDQRFPKLTHLGLKNCEFVDEIAGVLNESPVLERLTVLDLSEGALSDTGGEALLAAAPALAKLTLLDLSHNYFSKDMLAKLESLPCQVDLSGNEEPEDWGDGPQYMVAIGE